MGQIVDSLGGGYFTEKIGHIGSILAPTLIALILATGISPSLAFATFAVPSLIAAIGYILVQEKYGSFDRLSYEKVEQSKVVVEG